MGRGRLRQNPGGCELKFAVNHMTVPSMTVDQLISLARDLACAGIELRNDLAGPLFDGAAPESVPGKFDRSGLRLFALAELKAFDVFSDRTLEQAAALVGLARTSGAEAVSLIPSNDGQSATSDPPHTDLRLALRELKPLLVEAGLKAYIEPLGFSTCSLRRKSIAIDAIEAVDGTKVYGLIHDTFHHHLAGEPDLFPSNTAMVHVSGIRDPALPVNAMRDHHRGLVDAHDRLKNLEQLRALVAGGYDGPVSFECFAPEVHTLENIKEALANSMNFIKNSL